MWRIGTMFVACVIGFHLALWRLVRPDQIEWLQLVTARVSAFLISSSGIESSLQRTFIQLGEVRWEVTPECTAVSAAGVFLSFVLCYPARFLSEGIAVAVGIPLLFAANILRLFLLAWATSFDARLAEYVHDYVWQVAFLLLVVVMWLGWLALVVQRERVC